MRIALKKNYLSSMMAKFDKLLEIFSVHHMLLLVWEKYNLIIFSFQEDMDQVAVVMVVVTTEDKYL